MSGIYKDKIQKGMKSRIIFGVVMSFLFGCFVLYEIWCMTSNWYHLIELIIFGSVIFMILFLYFKKLFEFLPEI